MTDRPYTDNDQVRAANAVWEFFEGSIPAHMADPAARAVLDAVAADIARRERESIVAWLRAECDRLHSESLDMRLDVDASTRMHARSMAVKKAANAIEAHADQEADTP